MNLSEAVAAAERERDEARAKLTSELAVRDSREEQPEQHTSSSLCRPSA
ncbi:MAG: hypothetical protein ACLU37_02005 [Collinsella sp.]